MYDLIGDIHGHADELRRLLAKLGYAEQQGVYRHPTRQVIFVGDFVDRGPYIRETLRIVRAMVDGGAALAVMGNHEYNAICFYEKHPQGGHLRPHTPRNILQHLRTLEEFNGRELYQEWQDYIQWFKTLPLFLDLGALRVVHACWDPRHISFLNSILVDGRLTDAVLLRAADRSTPEYLAIEETLKGKEITLPPGLSFHDKDQNERTKMRVRWWCNPQSCTYADYYLESIPSLDPHPVDPAALPDAYHYAEETPVFFGHYWLRGTPQILRPHAVCLDYSVARGGQLVAYRWSGEQTLLADNLVTA
ncbi:metallophosphoesterase [Hymenobacter chitinivorans]|uniref:Calcineurin-like phosphoesterase family protein n=1 Tax=Hymenobacter chitinivorans DSM 11115 TaxID=1121954 RepID=A0A2M9BNX1_9BACT|nr:metallophosphoesterase [Hymenobacter chitinivorans]PJJ59645.1 calcineurin-like phosphoesterase family protein [Hymenobacter chitinivorans DSM 11115]